jgi:suppressor of G2 allele of SKP1
MWGGLDVESGAAARAVPASSTSAAMARPYASTRDWDAIGSDLKKKEEEEKPEGEEALNKLFKVRVYLFHVVYD